MNLTALEWTILIGIGTIVVGGGALFLGLLGMLFGGIYKFGRVEQSLEKCNHDHAAAKDSREKIHTRINDFESTIDLRLAALDSKVGELTGALKTHLGLSKQTKE